MCEAAAPSVLLYIVGRYLLKCDHSSRTLKDEMWQQSSVVDTRRIGHHAAHMTPTCLLALENQLRRLDLGCVEKVKENFSQFCFSRGHFGETGLCLVLVGVCVTLPSDEPVAGEEFPLNLRHVRTVSSSSLNLMENIASHLSVCL